MPSERQNLITADQRMSAEFWHAPQLNDRATYPPERLTAMARFMVSTFFDRYPTVSTKS